MIPVTAHPPRTTALSLALLLAVGFMAYANTFHVPFQWDEDFYIQNNPFVRGDRSSLESFAPSDGARKAGNQGMLQGELSRTVKMRYAGFLTFALNYRMHGLAVEGYHAVNLMVHLLNAVLVYFLVLTLLRTPGLQGSVLQERPGALALFTALLFVAHPVQTEAVTYIMQRLASLATFWYVLAVVLYLRSRLAAARARIVVLSVCAIVSSVLAMKTKEISFTLPLVVAACELVLFPGDRKQRLLRLLPMAATMLIIPVTMYTASAGDPWQTAPGGGLPSAFQYLITQFRVIVTYLRLLVWPAGQSVYHAFRLSTTFWEPAVIGSFLLLISIAVYGVRLLLPSRTADPGMRLVALGIFWFFAALAVESSFLPLPLLLCEYRIYLPSIGFFLAASAGIHVAAAQARDRRWERAVSVALVIAVTAGVSATVLRNGKWGSTVTLWEDALSKNPGYPAVHFKVAEIYLKEGRFDEAIGRFQSAVRLGMDHPRLHYELGTAYTRSGRYAEAVQEFQTALRLYPDFPDAHYDLGCIYTEQRRYGEAIGEYEAAVRLNPRMVEAHNNLAGVYAQLGRYAEARRELELVLDMNPGLEDARFNMQFIAEMLEKERQGGRSPRHR